MRRVLLAAGTYNLLWGAAVILFPNALFEWTGIAPLNYPEIWQCVGMIVGVYGVGYAIAALDPLVHWPIVLVGLLGKVFGPIGFVGALAKGTFPPAFGVTILTNDLVWWVPFGLILWASLKEHAMRNPSTGVDGAPLASSSLRTSRGETLGDLSTRRPVFAALVRHGGCTFCREALDDLAAAREAVELAGAALVVVHMGQDGLDDPRLLDAPDPELRLYRQLGLPHGTFGQLFGPAVWGRGFSACVLRGYGVGGLDGDGFQLGGLALIDAGEVVWKRALTSAAERPDYAAEARVAIASTERGNR